MASLLSTICSDVGMDTDLQNSFAKVLGFPGGVIGQLHPTVVAAVPQAMFEKGISEWDVSFFQKSLAMQVYAAAKKECEPPSKCP